MGWVCLRACVGACVRARACVEACVQLELSLRDPLGLVTVLSPWKSPVPAPALREAPQFGVLQNRKIQKDILT